MTENDFQKIEKKWQKKWEKKKLFKVKEKGRKFYVLEMYPYPSASFLHMGHVRNYTIGDVFARFKRMQGFNILYPMGYDSFGLPAEIAAKKAGIHPKKYTENAIKKIIAYQKALGNSYDWNRTLASHKPDYYKWNQYFFLKFLENGLAYRKKAPVNWCSKCESVLANEEAESGKCWRCGEEVIQKELEQWFFKITDYADRLLKDLDKIDWPEKIKIMQKNWIGKSYGTEIDFEINNPELNCIIIHGCPSKSENNPAKRTYDKHWIPWIKQKLEEKGIQTITPLMPEPWHADYEKWKKEFDKLKVNENTILIGHSCGCAFLVRWLGETKKKINKLILIAPWKIAESGNASPDFYNYQIDEKINQRVNEIIFFTSNDEEEDGKKSVKIFSSKLNAKIIELKNHGHYTQDDMGTIELPELLDKILEKWPIFTTRPDTIYGVTFMVISTQHPKLIEIVTENQKQEVQTFLKKLKKLPEEEMEKQGVFTGSYAINPLTKEKVPVYAGNFVVADYGSGIVMAVPAHDSRDFEFAKKYNISIKQVIAPNEKDFEKSNEILKALKIIKKEADKKKIDFWILGGLACGFHSGIIYRGFSDLDLIVKDKENYKKFCELLENLNYKKMNEKKLSDNLVSTIYQNKEKIEVDIGPNIWAFGLKKEDFEEDEKELNNIRYKVLSKRFCKSFKEYLLTQRSKEKDKLDLEYLKEERAAYTGEGKLINSGQFNDMDSEKAREEITKFLEKQKLGRKKINYKLRDWMISRQRYWGTPIPIIYCDNCGIVGVPEKDLPVLLPEKVDFKTSNPLASNKDFLNVKCSRCSGSARRETDTMSGFVDSSWYFLRYCDNKNKKKPFDKKKVDYWMPVDQYIGGAEHAVMHLMYARFFTKVLNDLKFIDFNEPFTKLFNQGIVYKDGNKMSKSKGNVVYQTNISNRYGIDTARLFLMFVSSPDKQMEWSDEGIEGAFRIIKKIIRLKDNLKKSDEKQESKINKTIKIVTKSIEKFEYPKAIIAINELTDMQLSKKNYEILLKLISPFCPHITEELWKKIGNKSFLSLSSWPKADESKINEKFEEQEKLIEKLNQDILNIKKITGKTGKVYVYVLPNELKIYKNIPNIKVYAVNDKNKYDPQGKARKAKPSKPAIYLE